MKQTKIFLLLVLTIFQFTAFSQDKKVALTTFYVSKHIGFEELDGNVGLAASIASLSEDARFDLTSVLNNFYKTFNDVYVPQFPFSMIPTSAVTESEAYKAYEGRFDEAKDADAGKWRQRFLVVDGFKPLTESLINKEKSNPMQMVEMFKETADGIMFVSLSYDFVKKAVPLLAGIRANVKIKVWNKEGEKVFAVNESAVSKKSVAIVAGIPVMSVDKLLPLCEDASAELIEDLGKRMGKIAKKSAKNF